jgi:hypothetical protein
MPKCKRRVKPEVLREWVKAENIRIHKELFLKWRKRHPASAGRDVKTGLRLRHA